MTETEARVKRKMEKVRAQSRDLATKGAETNNMNLILKSGKLAKEWFFLRDILLNLKGDHS